jgi:hypothetical protein
MMIVVFQAVLYGVSFGCEPLLVEEGYMFAKIACPLIWIHKIGFLDRFSGPLLFCASRRTFVNRLGKSNIADWRRGKRLNMSRLFIKRR